MMCQLAGFTSQCSLQVLEYASVKERVVQVKEAIVKEQAAAASESKPVPDPSSTSPSTQTTVLSAHGASSD